MTGAEQESDALIFALVEATNHQIAISRAKPVFDDVVTSISRPVESFRDYMMFHGDEVEQLREKWGEKPSAASLDSAEGQMLLEEAWNLTEELFMHDLNIVEELLSMYTAEEIMQNAENVRLHFLRLGETIGPSVPLYTESGYSIRDEAELERFLETHGEIWIVPAIGVT